MVTNKPITYEEYRAGFPKKTQEILDEIRATIKKAVPAVEEKISYSMPAYKLNGKVLVYFAAYPNHIGLYATPQGHQQFAEELSKYKQGKGSVQFPIDQPIPLDLIARIAQLRVGI